MLTLDYLLTVALVFTGIVFVAVVVEDTLKFIVVGVSRVGPLDAETPEHTGG